LKKIKRKKRIKKIKL